MGDRWRGTGGGGQVEGGRWRGVDGGRTGGGGQVEEGTGSTCDVFAKLIILLPQCPQQLEDAVLLHQGQLVVGIVIDEVAHGTCGVALHFLVGVVEELHQPRHGLKAAGLRAEAYGGTQMHVDGCRLCTCVQMCPGA